MRMLLKNKQIFLRRSFRTGACLAFFRQMRSLPPADNNGTRSLRYLQDISVERILVTEEDHGKTAGLRLQLDFLLRFLTV